MKPTMKPIFSQSEWRKFTRCPRQFQLSRSQEADALYAQQETPDRQRRVLLGTIVDEVIAHMYLSGWLKTPSLLVERLTAATARQVQRLYPQYTVLEPPTFFVETIAPAWLSLFSTVQDEHLYAERQVAVRRDFKLEFPAAVLMGQPDLTFIDERAVTVVDVKWRAKSSLDRQQLYAYRELVQGSTARPVTRLGFWLPRDAAVVWCKKLPAPPDLATDVAAMARGVNEARPANHCHHCAFRSACPEGSKFLHDKMGSMIDVTGKPYTGRPEIVGF